MQTTATLFPTITPISPVTTRSIRIIEDRTEYVIPPYLPDAIFNAEVYANREHEYILIHTHHKHFWEEGNTHGDLIENLEIQYLVDGQIQDVFPFYSWSSSAVQEIFAEDGTLLGSYMATGMTINFDTHEIPLGEHSLTIQVTNLSGVVFEKSWDILISPEIRESMSVELVPTAQYLQQSSESIPEFIQYVDISTRYFDRFSYHNFPSREGVCVYPEGPIFSALVGSSNSPLEFIKIAIDGETLPQDKVSSSGGGEIGRWSICVETNYLENGLHLATFTLLIDPPRSYTWVFSAEP